MTTFTDPNYKAYASASDVANLCRNLLGPEYGFNLSSSPTIIAVNSWLSSGCSIIESRLQSDGYTVPIAETTILYQWLVDLNALYGAARAETSRINVTLASGERTRGQIFEEMFWKQLDKMLDLDLATVGATTTTATGLRGQTLFVGGTSKISKDNYKDDSDRVEPRFSKGMFNMPGTITSNSAEDEEDD